VPLQREAHPVTFQEREVRSRKFSTGGEGPHIDFSHGAKVSYKVNLGGESAGTRQRSCTRKHRGWTRLGKLQDEGGGRFWLGREELREGPQGRWRPGVEGGVGG